MTNNKTTTLLMSFIIALGLYFTVGSCKAGAEAPFDAYKVDKGDSFWYIAQRYGLSMDALIKLNPNVDPLNMQVGSIIKLRETTPVKPSWEQKADAIIAVGMQHLGDTYQYGAERYEWLSDTGKVYLNPNFDQHKFDCSSFMQYIYALNGIDLHGTSLTQSQKDGVVIDRNDLRKGDLVFFYSPVNHVAMVKDVLPDGTLVLLHTYSTKVGVATSYMYTDHGWYNDKFTVARRVIQ